MRWLLLLSWVLLVGCVHAERGITLAFREVRLFDGEKVWDRTNLLVRGDRIAAVGTGSIPPGVEVVEGDGRTLLPGLIDAHVHLWEPAQLEQSLTFGVTTVLDMFTQPETARTLRQTDGPGRADFRSAGHLANSARGHGTQFGVKVPPVSNPAEAQAWVDARLAEGSDYIKIVYDAGKSYGRPQPTVSRETLTALIEATHARGKLALVHIMDHDAARDAIAAGADGLVHAFRDRLPDADFAANTAAARTFVIPTLTVLRSFYQGPGRLADDPHLQPYLLPGARDNLRARPPLTAQGPPDAVAQLIGQLHAAGVPILCGSDAPNLGTTYGATVHEELELLVAAGLPPRAALTAATTAAARAFRLSDRGRLAPGLRADLLLVEGDPTREVTHTRRIVGVWRGGQRFDREAVKAAVAAAIAGRNAPAEKRGLVNDFEEGQLDNRFGTPWTGSTDAVMGGRSKVELQIVAAGTGKALAITGTIVAGQAPFTWAGAMFAPGGAMFEPLNLSANQGLRFKAKGDGKTYTAMLFTKSRGPVPLSHTFTPGTNSLEPVALPWSSFEGNDGGDITGIFVGATTPPGAFSLLIDDVELY